MADPAATAAPEAPTAGPSTPTAPSRIREQVADLRNRLPERMRDPSHWADEAEALIRAHPLKAVAGVFVGGVVVGYLLRGRR